MTIQITLSPPPAVYPRNDLSALQADREESAIHATTSVLTQPATPLREKKHASLVDHVWTAAPNESPERAIIRMFSEFSEIQETVLDYLRIDMEMHVATLKEMTAAAKEISRIWVNEKDTVAADFDILMDIDARSPIGRGGDAEHPAPTQMSLKEMLIKYDVLKTDEAVPTDKKAIEALKDAIETRNTNMSSTTQLQQLDINKVTTSREQSFSMVSSLLRQLIESLNNVIKRLS